MSRITSRYQILTLGAFLVSSLLFQAVDAWAAPQFEEDIKILRMYYRDDEIVVSTRHPKPLSQAAEDITVITAEEIEAMNAHTVAEVLNRVPGLFVSFTQGFGASSLPSIQGSDQWHVLVLVDEIPWNFNSNGVAETNSIPVGIIDRIEIIKGPASSTWGSSLGGVVNIITKPAGDEKRASGSLRGSLGERKTRDYRAQIHGKAGPAGYYLFAGRQDSDGFIPSSEFENYSLFSKLRVSLCESVHLGMQFGHTDIDMGLGDFPTSDITSSFINSMFHARTFLEASFSKHLSLHASAYWIRQELDQATDTLGLSLWSPDRELFRQTVQQEETHGGNARLVLETLHHTVVLGMDYSHGHLDETIRNGQPLILAFGMPATEKAMPHVDRWAVYANDTIVIKGWSITPGIRFDYNDVSGSFVSPSLGATYRWGDHSIFRASVSRGFTYPPLSWSSSGGLFLEPNPDLEEEEVWSYQAGVESTAARYVWLKATFFRHDLENALILEVQGAGPPTFYDLFVNKGRVERMGVEAEAETLPVCNFSLWAGFSYVYRKPSEEPDATVWYTYNAGLRYRDDNGLKAELFGHFIWWDKNPAFGARYDDFVWDFDIQKMFPLNEHVSAIIFASVHNLFDGLQYDTLDHENPERWVEAGFKLFFD